MLSLKLIKQKRQKTPRTFSRLGERLVLISADHSLGDWLNTAWQWKHASMLGKHLMTLITIPFRSSCMNRKAMLDEPLHRLVRVFPASILQLLSDRYSKHRHRFSSNPVSVKNYMYHLSCSFIVRFWSTSKNEKHLAHDMTSRTSGCQSRTSTFRPCEAPLSRLFSLGAQEGSRPSSPGTCLTVATCFLKVAKWQTANLVRRFPLENIGDSWVVKHDNQPIIWMYRLGNGWNSRWIRVFQWLIGVGKSLLPMKDLESFLPVWFLDHFRSEVSFRSGYLALDGIPR